jgi:tungstate transport system substrate-binding protein
MLVVVFLLTSWSCRERPDVVRIATTTSVENSGLLAAILPAFERQHRIRVEVLAVGSGQALNLVRRGDAALGLTHDPAAESAALAAGAISGYRKFMFNDFVIVGPPSDPAGVSAAADVVDALGRVVEAAAPFVSRDDGSGTSSRDKELWGRVERLPPPGRSIRTGQGMGAALRVASERGAYTLADRATFEQFRSGLQLKLLYEGGRDLLNTYAIFFGPAGAAASPNTARVFADWLAEGEGRALVARYQVNGQIVFTVWPAGVPRNKPGDLPDPAVADAR